MQSVAGRLKKGWFFFFFLDRERWWGRKLRVAPPPPRKRGGGGVAVFPFKRKVPLSLSRAPSPRARGITRPLGREAAKGSDILASAKKRAGILNYFLILSRKFWNLRRRFSTSANDDDDDD